MAVSTIKSSGNYPMTDLNVRIKYWRTNGITFVRLGTDQTEITKSGVWLGTLPEGFRPPMQMDFAGTSLGGTQDVFFRVEWNGDIKGFTGANTTYWSGVFSFVADH